MLMHAFFIYIWKQSSVRSVVDSAEFRKLYRPSSLRGNLMWGI